MVNDEWTMKNWYRSSIKDQDLHKQRAGARQWAELPIYAKSIWDLHYTWEYHPTIKDGRNNTWQGQRNSKQDKGLHQRLESTDRNKKQSIRAAQQAEHLGEPAGTKPGTTRPGRRLEWHLTTWAKPPRAKGSLDNTPWSLWDKLKEAQSLVCKSQKND